MLFYCELYIAYFVHFTCNAKNMKKTKNKKGVRHKFGKLAAIVRKLTVWLQYGNVDSMVTVWEN